MNHNPVSRPSRVLEQEVNEDNITKGGKDKYMKDIIELSYEAKVETEHEPLRFSEVFAEKLLKDLAKVSGKDIAPYLTCNYELPLEVYDIQIKIPAKAYYRIQSESHEM